MNFTAKSPENIKINVSNNVRTLNPNAAEFVPSAFRATYGNTRGADSSRIDTTGTSGKTILSNSEFSSSNSSDDEAHQFWCNQLPDDITPDFKAMGEDELPSPGQLSLGGLSICNSTEPSRFSASTVTETFGIREGRSLSLSANNLNLSGNMSYSGPTTYTEDQSPAARIALATNSWGRQFINGDQRFTRLMEGQHCNGDSSANFLNNMLGDQAVAEDAAIDHVDFLTSQFPGFSAENLSHMYCASGCDLNDTIEMLSQLELQGDVGFSKNLNLKSLSLPSLRKIDLQSLPVGESHDKLSMYTKDPQQLPDTYRSASSVLRASTDFVSTIRKFLPLDSSHWKHESNGSADAIIGSSRSSQLLASSYNGQGKLLYRDKSPSLGASRTAPVWFETGEAAANMYSESREEARDLARLQDACLEQENQAHQIGNKALARELSEKRHFYNMQMNAAHLKTGDTIYRKRDPVSHELQSYSRGQDCLIDLSCQQCFACPEAGVEHLEEDGLGFWTEAPGHNLFGHQGPQ